MSKRILLLLIALVIGAFALFTFVGKGHGKAKSNKVDPAYKEYIAGFTSGYVSIESSLRVVLKAPTTATIEISKESDNTLFEFSPGIDGKVIWIDNQTVEFKPSAKLKHGQLYTAVFRLSEVMDVPPTMKNFEFTFQTIPQAVDIESEDLIITNGSSSFNYSGIMSTADFATNENVEKSFTASHLGKALKVSWSHENPTTHRFTISGIQKQSAKSQLLLSINAEAIEAKENFSKNIDVPALNVFSIMTHRVTNNPDQALIIQCSEALSANQNLDGLIEITHVTDVTTNNDYYGYSNNPGNESITYTYSIEHNLIRIFPQTRLAGDKMVKLNKSIKNASGKSLSEEVILNVNFEEIKPAVRVNGKGIILPSSEGLVFPFEAVNLNAVDVKITKIYENNILQFLQVNNMDGKQELMRVGKTVLKKKIPLNSLGTLASNKWTRYALDLSKLISAEPGAIYNVKLSFRKEYSTYDCKGDTSAASEYEMSGSSMSEEQDEDDEKDWDYYGSYYSYDYDYYYYDYYSYKDRENPCTPSYYSSSRAVTRNILSTNIGLMVKKGNDGSYLVVANDIISTKPLSGVDIEAYDYQSQLLGTFKTNEEGLAMMNFKKKPFVIVSKNGEQRNYIKLEDGQTNSLSTFNVSGDLVLKGLKGFIYGERGVWRPGDSLFLTFILEDKQKTLPINHPVSFELINPMGQTIQKTIKTNGLEGFYDFRTRTDNYAPTGNYLAKIKVGGAVFTKNIKIETIMPNRLKLNLDFKTEKLYTSSGEIPAELSVNWLHGAPGKNLLAKVDVSYSPTTTEFKSFKGYTFDNPASNFNSELQTLFEGRTDENGFTSFQPNFSTIKNAPGFLNANFIVRGFEEGGAFSTDRFSLPLSPYSYYVGVKPPEVEERGYLETDKDQIIQLASVDEKGNPVNRSLQVKVYKIGWSWWWDNYNENLSSYVGGDYHQPILTEEVNTINGKGSFKLRVNRPSWGRYLIYVTDSEGGHSCGKVVYIDWPSWAGKSPKGNEGANLLTFSCDKEEYKVGEKVKLSIPSAKKGRAFISVESGSKVIKTFWKETNEGVTDFEFDVTSEMAPNIYVYTTLIQPHGQVMNDLPIRLYGVQSLLVKDENTILKPKIQCDEVWRPESVASVKVSEEKGKEMIYTLAVVDDGLLDLTRFKTPDPWSTFYAKEALGVKTWDVYDMIIGSSGKVLQRILSIGGDESGADKSGSKAQRFKPMVRFIGPFKLKKGETATHKIEIPQYVGSARVMVVAGKDAAYGNAEKNVKIRKPLMILSTLPRVLGPDEEVDLPVSVFAMEKKVKNATITIKPDKHFTVIDGNTKSVSFNRPDEKMVYFRLKVKPLLGVAKVKISANGSGETANEEIEIEIRTPNPYMSDVKDELAEKGKNVSLNYQPFGISGTNKAVVEISSMPAINLEQRLNYLIQYPHGCVEQTTSSVFAQLYLEDVTELSDAQKSTVSANVKEAINRLKGFQTLSGGLAYWPGSNIPDDWGSNYAGHFLLEAQNKGFTLPYGLIDNWKKYQKQRAQNWVASKNALMYQEDLTQAYRLYTLALAGSPDLGSMNRLKESKNISPVARWRLAAAYAKAGQTETAKKLIVSIPTTAGDATDMSYTYGSSTRDEAMILETLTILGMKSQSFESLKLVAKALSENEWMSTQTTAYALIAISRYVKATGAGSGIMADCTINGSKVSVNSKVAIKQFTVTNANAASSIIISNKGTAPLFVRLIRSGIPAAGEENAANSNLTMNITYTTLKGEELDVSNLDQGTDFIATVTINHPGIRKSFRNLSLSQIFPTGWEIHNSRMDENQSGIKSDIPTYQDIRDDRVYTYFDISRNATKTFRVMLNASYTGKFYLPGVVAEAMYDNSVFARLPGKWVEVKKGGETVSSK